MIVFPCAKINLGLNVVERRPDGYHNLQTVFLPIPICDALEVETMDEQFPSDGACDLKVTGNVVECDESDNLIVKAYNILAADFDIPRVHAHLYKNIPSEAGLGGGSSDAAFMIRLLDQRFNINMGNAAMESYAARLGADCPFFISAKPSFAEGIGEILSPVKISENNLNGYSLVVVKPNIAVSTKTAFTHVRPQMPRICCRDVVAQPIKTWKEALSNDFEKSVFAAYPQLNDIKEQLYKLGADYAQMSGSGSSIFGIFKSKVDENDVNNCFPYCRNFILTL